MSEMVKRVAKAIHEAIVVGNEEAARAARAAIESMREPTEAMKNAAEFDAEDGHYMSAWRAMIGEALK